MNDVPKILVGTLWYEEEDREKHLEAIQSQEGVEIDHFTISNLPEVEAHRELWSKFESRKKDFDMITKIDADTVLITKSILRDIYDIMLSDPKITSIQANIDDYWTGDLIAGLNSFRPIVKFNPPSSNLFCDRVDTGHIKQLKGKNVPSHVIPAAYHCHNAGNKQGFHFGIVRVLKGHAEVIQKVQDMWRKHRDDRRTYALLGMMMAPNFIDREGFNYGDKKFESCYEYVCENYEELKSKLVSEML